MKVAIPHGVYLIHFGIEGKIEGDTFVEIGGIADTNKLKNKSLTESWKIAMKRRRNFSSQ